MRKVYYNPMRKLTLILPALAPFLLVALRGAPQQQSSLKTSSLESHEGMTIYGPAMDRPPHSIRRSSRKSPRMRQASLPYRLFFEMIPTIA